MIIAASIISYLMIGIFSAIVVYRHDGRWTDEGEFVPMADAGSMTLCMVAAWPLFIFIVLPIVIGCSGLSSISNNSAVKRITQGKPPERVRRKIAENRIKKMEAEYESVTRELDELRYK